MAIIEVTDRNGSVVEVDASNSNNLMEILRDAGLGIDGTCGGMCACGTCHVHILDEGGLKLSEPAEDEADMLLALADVVEITATSRLACQINLAPEASGIKVQIGPQL